MAPTEQLTDWSEKLKIRRFSREECRAAIHGQEIPTALGLPLLRLCVIRGIRYHDSFGTALRGVSPQFTRALNAREIMSNRIPTITSEEDTPYCIWHPEIASEETYRQLARTYPQMRYQIGRACAAAGYTNLYKELDVLPEVHIAEEARECGSTDIYEDIMSKPIRYNIMNDYDRCINVSKLSSGYLNGDTAVLRTLDVRQQFTRADTSSLFDDDEGENMFERRGFKENVFNITEDMCIDTKSTDEIFSKQHAEESKVLVKLLTEPLPLDLPIIDKKLLICMAAYYGDIDRYVRLRRPNMVPGELECCIRGVYHNTMFAVWWSKQDIKGIFGGSWLRQAIDARYVMSNVLSRAVHSNYSEPYLIWYPTLASPSTYRELARLRPLMLPQIVRACIVAGYTDLFDELASAIKPDDALLKEAAESANPHFREMLQSRASELGTASIPVHESWKLLTHTSLQHSSATVSRAMFFAGPRTAFAGLYNRYECDAANTELMACLPDEWKLPEDAEEDRLELDYDRWPPRESYEP